MLYRILIKCCSKEMNDNGVTSYGVYCIPRYMRTVWGLLSFIVVWCRGVLPLQWRHNGCDGISNHQPHDCLRNCLFRRRSNKTSKFRVTGLCARNSPGTGEFPAQMASNAVNGSIWWRHHAYILQNRHLVRWHWFNHTGGNPPQDKYWE